MKILVIDDEQLSLNYVASLIKKELPDEEIFCFSSTKKGSAFILENKIDIAFLDIHIGGGNGVEFAKEILKIYPNCNIIFTTGYSNFYQDAFDLAASDYLLKPINEEKIAHALSTLRNPVISKRKRIYFKCFPSFEIYIDGVIDSKIKNKTKELLAYLVAKEGSLVSNAELLENIWEYNSDAILRMTKKSLVEYLKSINAEQLLIQGWGKLGVNKDLFDCEYYSYLAKDETAINSYHGEFMNQYSWSSYLFKE